MLGRRCKTKVKCPPGDGDNCTVASARSEYHSNALRSRAVLFRFWNHGSTEMYHKGFWRGLREPIAYIGSCILANRQSKWCMKGQSTHGIPEAVSWKSEPWKLWKLWCLSSVVKSSFYWLGLYHMLGADGFHDWQRVLSVYDSNNWEIVPLLQCHRAGLNSMQSPGPLSASGNSFGVTGWMLPSPPNSLNNVGDGFLATKRLSNRKAVPPTLYLLFNVFSSVVSRFLSSLIIACSMWTRHIETSRIVKFCFQPIGQTLICSNCLAYRQKASCWTTRNFYSGCSTRLSSSFWAS